LIILLLVLVNMGSVQTYLAQRASSILSKKLQTKVSVQNVRIDLLNHVFLEGLYIEDQQRDTLASIGKAELRITDWFFLKGGTPVLHYIGLSNAFIHLYRPINSAKWNYAFIEEAFASDSKKKNTSQQSFEFDLDKIMLDNVRFHMDDAWVGYDYDLDFGRFLVNVEELNFTKKIIDITKISLAKSSIRVRDYQGGKPPSAKKPYVIDTTAFNPDGWQVKLGNLLFDEVHFRYVSKAEKAIDKQFDPEYIEVHDLNTDIKNVTIVGDTLRARIDHFSAKERSGFVVQELQSKVSLSPIAALCTELFIQTNNSTIGDYYAMHYDRFPDFEDYIAKVKMDARLKESQVDAKDVAYFAPQLRDLPIGITKISGEAKGTVDHLVAKNVNATDGFSTLKGDLTIIGLPDVDSSIFDFQNGEIFTTGNSVLKYAPALKNNPNINIKAIDYAYFSGSFKGLLNDFAAKGIIKTNLGMASADMVMKMPYRSSPTYSGTLSSSSFDLGRLLNQSSLGKTTFKAQLQGASFDLAGFHIKAKSTFQDFTFNGYTYRDIVADGIFDKSKFDGQLIINDSNLAAAFNGSIDFSEKDIKIVATANLLSSDLKALHFVEAPTTLSADFDLDCSGKTIDDFTGSAKLYNIDLHRHTQRMDLDSINILSYNNGQEKHLDVESNLLRAKVDGQFLLSEIPNSMQFYLSKYLPNYITAPASIAANQNLNFSIKTHQVDNLLKAFTLYVSGFDSSTILGNFNTSTRSLSLDATVPFGKVGNLKFYKAKVLGLGDYNNLSLKTSIASFIVGDNLLNTSLDLDAELGNDSLNYTIVTKSDEQYGTATIAGKAYTSRDSLYLSFLPSEFYLNNAKWEIDANNKIVYANKYLSINNFNLGSGLQQLKVNTDFSKPGHPILINTYNLDIAQLASLTSAAEYKPEGRINGQLSLQNIFGQAKMSANMEATGVSLFGDTLGLIKIIGNYDAEKEWILLDKNSGIFNPKFSLLSEGKISLNTQSTEQLDAKLRIANFPLKFLQPFLKGYASKIGGTLDGEVSINGSLKNPVFDGGLSIINVLAKVDYIGALYNIPKGNIKIKNQTLSLDNIELFDVYKNKALATGTLQFSKINNPIFDIKLSTDQFEVVNLKDYENDLFYGHVIAKANFTVAGSLNNINMAISATPTQKSSLFLPYNSAGDHSANTYITFKTIGNAPSKQVLKSKDKLGVKISAILNNLMDVTLVLDPNTGDQITANGNGNLSIDVPANEDYSMFGTYNIERGKYLFTFRQVLSKEFLINGGSSISFAGNIANTRLDVLATYPTTARLFDLLDNNKAEIIKGSKEEEDAKTAQAVNVQLRMKGTLAIPDLNYEIELVEKRSIGTTAYAELNRINNSDKTALTNQVSSLLLLGSFIPSQGITSTLAVTGAKNTLGETIASQASPLLSSALNKLLGDQKLQVLVQYKSFGQDVSTSTSSGSSPISSTDTRNQVKFGLKKNYFNDRLSLQIGSAYDWGRPSNNNQNTSSFNLAGDFRAQYLLTPDGGFSLIGFRTSSYDLFVGNNVARQGMGITYRKNFDNFYEFIHSKKRIARERQEKSRAK
jgi:hypothetical protein